MISDNAMESTLRIESEKVQHNEVVDSEESIHEQEVPADIEDDPHRAALLEANLGSFSRSTIYSVFFLGLSVVSPISSGQIMAGSMLNPIAISFGATSAEVNWVLSGWAIASTVSVTSIGKLSDIYGRRWMMLVGNFFALLGSIVAASAQSVSAVIAGSTLNGFGFGFILLVFTCVPELCPFKYRGIGLSWVEFCLFVPWGVAGPLLANLLYEHASWRWTYYIGIIYSAVSLAGLAIFYFPPLPLLGEGKTRWQALKEVDFIGFTLFTTGLPVFLLGISWAGTPGHSWSSVSVLAPLVIGALIFCSAFIYDLKFAGEEKAFLPPRLFYQFREYTAHLVVGAVTGMIYYTNAGLLPQANLYLFTNDPIQIGINMLPNGFGQFFGSTVVPGLLHLTKAPKFFIVLAIFLQTLFVGLYAYAIPDHHGAWIAFQFFGQGCFDWIITCGVVNLSLHVRHSDLGLAMGIFGMARNLGGSVGIAIFNTVLNSYANSHLGPEISAAAIKYGFNSTNMKDLIPAVVSNALGAPDAFADFPGGVNSAVRGATFLAFREVYTNAFRRVFYVTIPFGVISLIVSVFIRDAGKYMTNHISVFVDRPGWRHSHHDAGS